MSEVLDVCVPRDVRVSLSVAEFEALRYLVDYCGSQYEFRHARTARQALSDARMAVDVLGEVFDGNY
jgi:predicted DNA-binding protein (UPF0251 family)